MAIHKLKQLQVEKSQAMGMMNDGGGLYLKVRNSSSKNWIYRYTLQGKTVDMGLGSYPTISLAQARKDVEQWRKIKSQGLDPKHERDKERRELELKRNETKRTFEECAIQYIDTHRAEWTNKKHIQQWENTLNTYVYPVMGDITVDEVNVQLVMAALKPIWNIKVETATRVRQRIENILDWASAHGFRSNDNPARWKGHLDKLLPKPSKLKKVKHHPALPYAEVGKLMNQLKTQTSIRARALEFTILTGLRTSEVLGAKWTEIDLDNNVWLVPAERMKMKKEHRVPLSSTAKQIIKDLPRLYDNDHLFFGTRHGRHLSNMSMLTLLQRDKSESGLGYQKITVHGFRSTFRDWAAEETSFPRELCEIALAHDVRSAVESAYQRGDLLEKRRELMDAWDRYIHIHP